TDLERPQAGASSCPSELAPDILLGQHVAGNELGERDGLAKERCIAGAFRGCRDRQGGLLERRLAVAAQTLGIRADRREPVLAYTRRVGEKLVQPTRQRCYRGPQVPSVAGAAPVHRRRDDDLAA